MANLTEHTRADCYAEALCAAPAKQIGKLVGIEIGSFVNDPEEAELCSKVIFMAFVKHGAQGG